MYVTPPFSCDLLMLYFQMGTLVEQHEPIINRIQDTAIEAEGDVMKGCVPCHV